MWREQMEGFVALPLGAVLLQMRLDLDVLQTLLEKGNKGPGWNVGVGDNRPCHEALVRECERRVPEPCGQAACRLAPRGALGAPHSPLSMRYL